MDNPINEGRTSYDPYELPLRTDEQYADTVKLLQDQTLSSAARARIQKTTGVIALPLVSSSPLFRHPEFFPLDPFHLFNANIPQLMWSVLCAPVGTEYGLTTEQRQELGGLVATNSKMYPTSFTSRAPRNIAKYSNSSYRMVEWASIFHHFLPAYLHHVQAPAEVQRVLRLFVQGVDMAMTREGLSLEDVRYVKALFARFCLERETLYASSSATLSRSTLSVHHLLHVADQIWTLGSVRATSQATCERYIGILKRGLASFRHPYAMMSNRATAQTQSDLTAIRLGLKTPHPASDDEISPRLTVRYGVLHGIRDENHAAAIASLLSGHEPSATKALFYGRFSSFDGLEVRSSRAALSDSRDSSIVQLVGEAKATAQVLVFVKIFVEEAQPVSYAVIRRFNVSEDGIIFHLGNWSTELELLPLEAIKAVAGALQFGSSVYVVWRSNWQGADESLLDDDDDTQANV